MLYTSHIEISESAFLQNLKFIKGLIAENVLFSSVVKGNAYGHGIELFVSMAQKNGVSHFSVFSAAEAFRVLNSANSETTILIMGMLDNSQLEWAILNDIEFFVFDIDRLKNAIKIAKKIKKKAIIHLEIETGMNRTGLPVELLYDAEKLLSANASHILLKGVCTHFSGAESIVNESRIKKQQKTFDAVLQKLSDCGLRPSLIHSACSAATLRYPKSHMDMVRIGILQYGYFPNNETHTTYITEHKSKEPFLKRVISWKSKVMDIKSISAGEYIGYGTSYLASVDMKIAIIPVGYSDGFTRSLSNLGRVLINGERVRVLGMVNMNMMTVDASNLPNLKNGDEVVLIGKQGEQEITVASFSEYSELVNYEFLTRLPPDIPRKLVD